MIFLLYTVNVEGDQEQELVPSKREIREARKGRDYKLNLGNKSTTMLVKPTYFAD